MGSPHYLRSFVRFVEGLILGAYIGGYKGLKSSKTNGAIFLVTGLVQLASGQAETIYVAAEICNIVQIDLTAATFWADIALHMRFANGTVYYGTPRIGNRAGNPTWSNPVSGLQAIRYYGSLSFIPDLKKFPFDSQTLEFSFSHPSRNATMLGWQSLSNETFISDLRLVNWRYSNSSLNVAVRLDKYAPGSANFNQVRMGIYMSRALPAGVQTLMSPSFALTMVFVSFWLPIKENITRIGMATAALVSEVFIHVSLRNSSLLNLNSLVTMDWFMFLCYMLIILAILTNVIITVLLRGSQSNVVFAKRLASRVRYVVWFFGPGVFTFLFFPAKQIYLPFIFILVPSFIALGIGWLVKRIKRRRNTHAKPIADPIEDPEETSTKDSDSEDLAPAALVDPNAQELDTKRAALHGEIIRPQGLVRTDSLGSVSSGSE